LDEHGKGAAHQVGYLDKRIDELAKGKKMRASFDGSRLRVVRVVTR
jgi:hypothetical protein